MLNRILFTLLIIPAITISQENKGNNCFLDIVDNSIPSIIMPFECSNRSLDKVINIRYFEAYEFIPEMLVIEFKSEKEFKVKYYYKYYYARCAEIDELVKHKEDFIGMLEFDETVCPKFAHTAEKLIKHLIPKEFYFALFFDVPSIDIFIDSASSILYFSTNLVQKSNKKIKRLFETAFDCAQLSFRKKEKANQILNEKH